MMKVQMYFVFGSILITIAMTLSSKVSVFLSYISVLYMYKVTG